MKTKALYAGSFDPLTLGHLDIIERASTMFDKLVVGVIMNPQKKSLFTLDEREKVVYEIMNAIDYLRKTKIGGLMVIEREISLNDYIQKSKNLSAEISSELFVKSKSTL